MLSSIRRHTDADRSIIETGRGDREIGGIPMIGFGPDWSYWFPFLVPLVLWWNSWH
nr:hypothetical protein JVH1_7513 [Rhodococcus sp. JVH1]